MKSWIWKMFIVLNIKILDEPYVFISWYLLLVILKGAFIFKDAIQPVDNFLKKNFKIILECSLLKEKKSLINHDYLKNDGLQ